jgi:hypothetical protein
MSVNTISDPYLLTNLLSYVVNEFSNNSLFFCGQAKCLIASVPKDGSAKTRTTLFEAISTLKTALDGFNAMQAFAKAKDVVYLMVFFCVHSVYVMSSVVSNNLGP